METMQEGGFLTWTGGEDRLSQSGPPISLLGSHTKLRCWQQRLMYMCSKRSDSLRLLSREHE